MGTPVVTTSLLLPASRRVRCTGLAEGHQYVSHPSARAPAAGPRGVPCGMMLPAGFEPASEARKAPILNRTRLRERKAGLVPRAINAFGNEIHGGWKTGNFFDAPSLGGRKCAASSRRSP